MYFHYNFLKSLYTTPLPPPKKKTNQDPFYYLSWFRAFPGPAWEVLFLHVMSAGAAVIWGLAGTHSHSWHSRGTTWKVGSAGTLGWLVLSLLVDSGPHPPQAASPNGHSTLSLQQGSQTSYMAVWGSQRCKGRRCQTFLRLRPWPDTASEPPHPNG